jgi:glycosyltransferase involved in cell wall biosynthesis
MRILHLRASNFYGGPERQIHIHARMAIERGYDIIAASFSERGQMPEFLRVMEQDGIPVHLFEVRNAYDIKAIGAVRKFIREKHIDILCTHDYRTHLIGFRAVNGTDAKWIAFSRGWTKDTLRVRVYGLLDKVFIRFAEHIVAVSEAQKSKLTRLSIAPTKITSVPNAIDPESLEGIESIDLRARFELPADSIIAVAGGRFSREKGQIFLVKAAVEAIKENDRLRFIIFGDGPDFKMIKERVSRAGLDKIILCPGFEKNLLGCLKAADLLLNPSFSEGLPNIVLEAMALHVPVIATAVGGVPELIKSGDSGLLIKAGDISGLSRAVLSLAADPEKRKRLARAAYKVVTDCFSFEMQMDLLSEVYQKSGAK